MSKYKFTYFLNTACAERRPQTRRDLIEDWCEEEKEFSLDIEAFEYAYTDICEFGDEEDLLDIYEDLPDQDDLTKINALKEAFESVDVGDGSTILISIEGPGQTYDSGYDQQSFNDDYVDDEEYDDEDYLDENKKLNESIDVNSFELRENSPQTKIICDLLSCTTDDIKTAVGFMFNDFEPEDYVVEMNDGTGRLINTRRNSIKEFATPQTAQEELFSDGANYNW